MFEWAWTTYVASPIFLMSVVRHDALLTDTHILAASQLFTCQRSVAGYSSRRFAASTGTEPDVRRARYHTGSQWLVKPPSPIFSKTLPTPHRGRSICSSARLEQLSIEPTQPHMISPPSPHRNNERLNAEQIAQGSAHPRLPHPPNTPDHRTSGPLAPEPGTYGYSAPTMLLYSTTLGALPASLQRDRVGRPRGDGAGVARGAPHASFHRYAPAGTVDVNRSLGRGPDEMQDRDGAAVRPCIDRPVRGRDNHAAGDGARPAGGDEVAG